MDLSRRKFLINTSLLVAAPAIVRASSLMPVKAVKASHPSWVLPGNPSLDIDFVNGRCWMNGKEYAIGRFWSNAADKQFGIYQDGHYVFPHQLQVFRNF